MELKVSVSEAMALIKEVGKRSGEDIGVYRHEHTEGGRRFSYETCDGDSEKLTIMWDGRYERKEGDTDYRNGAYTRTFCIKGIGDVEVRVPRDRNGDFQTQVLPRCQRYDSRITEDLAVMYMTGISTRTLSKAYRALPVSHGSK